MKWPCDKSLVGTILEKGSKSFPSYGFQTKSYPDVQHVNDFPGQSEGPVVSTTPILETKHSQRVI